MAEKYGTVPKKFTKAWWSWYWMYYKSHTICTLFVLLLICITVVDYITSEKYDVTLTYAGQAYINDSVQAKIEEVISPLCDDLDGNGEKSLFFSCLDVDMSSTDIEYLQARKFKIEMAFAEDKTYLFIMDKSMAEVYQGENVDTCAFAPLDDWVTSDISSLGTYTAHGEAYGVDISEIKIFKDVGIKTDELYMFMRYYPREEQKKEHLKGYEASIELANRIISSNYNEVV